MARRDSYFVGVMSGTSLDGVDAVLVDFSAVRPALIGHRYQAFPNDIRSELLALCASGNDEIERAGRISQRLAALYADCINGLLTDAGVDHAKVSAIGVHGQTVRHRPEDGYTTQLNAPARIAELTRIDVVADFRSRDVAAGGHGAPLAPVFHTIAFASERPRVVVNIGGISNITYLAPPSPVLGFDCGPGNVLLDLWAQRHRGEPFDRDGRLAAQGQVHARLLDAALADPFFSFDPPKSTGRELFSIAWLDALVSSRSISVADVQATLVALTARTIANSIERWCAAAHDAVICGGGARNPVLMAALARELSPRLVASSDTFGIDPDQVEALAFAWLAKAFVERRAGNIPSVTGASGPRILGALYPA